TVKYGSYFSPQIALEHLIDGLLAAKPTAKSNGRAQDAAAAATNGVPAVEATDEITYQGFYDFIPRFIDDHTIIGADASMNYFGSLLLKVPTPGGFIVQSSY